jgi:hypothetical protein
MSGGSGNFSASNGTLTFNAKSNGTISFDQQTCFLRFSNGDDNVVFEDTRGTPKGIEYAADYSADLINNPQSFADVATVNLLKQTLVSYTTTQRNAISSPAAGYIIYLEKRMVMNDANPIAQTVAVLLFLLACLSLNAQHAGCFGIDTTPTLTKEDKQALRLYSPLKWYDFSTYKFKGGGKRAVWIGYGVAGILHGGREAYHAQPNVFEKAFNAAPLSFWGSEQWKDSISTVTLKHKPTSRTH